jgi:hypothetical protein
MVVDGMYYIFVTFDNGFAEKGTEPDTGIDHSRWLFPCVALPAEKLLGTSGKLTWGFFRRNTLKGLLLDNYVWL